MKNTEVTDVGLYDETLYKRRLSLAFLQSAIAAILLVSLFSFNSLDPSFNRATLHEVNNKLGVVGAYLSDLMLQFFGYSSYILALILTLLALRNLFVLKRRLFIIGFVSSIIALLSGAILLSYHTMGESWPYYVSSGGLVGDLLNSFLTRYIEKPYLIVASVILFIVFFAISVRLRLSELAIACRFILKLFNNKTKENEDKSVFVDDEVEQESVAVVHKEKLIRPIKSDIVEFKERPVKKPKSEQGRLDLGDIFQIPSVTLLQSYAGKNTKQVINQAALSQNAKLLEGVLKDFGVQGEIIKVRPGPVVTLYELEPAPGTKSSRIIGLADDIARSMSAISARIAVVPGRNAIGIELPNAKRETVYLRELLESDEFQDKRYSLPIALGKDIGGDAVITDLTRMPHLLVAGTTGSGKSVAINTMILSFLYRMTPEQCKFIMIDPKMLELSVYEGIPHLLSPVVTEPSKAVVALKWAVREMENRYRLMSNVSVRNITGYNKKIEDAVKTGEVLERVVQTGFDPETGRPITEKISIKMEKLPFIVIIVDEMADLMLTAGKDIESSIQRLAQMARAAGIHIIMATQRPSVDIITGVIKANFPTRISFQVTSRIDSRTILGEQGAEQLLGMGDMLYMAGGGKTVRVHGPFVDDKEVNDVVAYLKTQGEPCYVEDVTKEDEFDEETTSQQSSGDDLYDQAVAIVIRDKKASTSYVQRQLKIGYNRAANLIEKMEKEGVISQANHVGKREVLVN